MNRRDAADEARENQQWIIALVVRDIDERTSEERDLLLSDLLCAAWPSQAAQTH